MEFNKLIFNIPKSSYSVFDPDLIWIPKQKPQSMLQRLLKTCSETHEYQNDYIPCFYLEYLPQPTNSCKQPNEKVQSIAYYEHSKPTQHTYSANVLVYFHANAEDIGNSYDFIVDLSQALRTNILAVEYPGYGVYQSQKPSEKRVFEDAKIVVQYLIDVMDFKERNIMIVGKSLGSAIATYVTQYFQSIQALVLISPFSNIKQLVRQLFGKQMAYLVKDQFKTSQFIRAVKCPTFIIHGQKDELIPLSQSFSLIQNCNCKVGFYFPATMTHNCSNYFRDIIEPLINFCAFHNIETEPNQKQDKPNSMIYNYGLVNSLKEIRIGTDSMTQTAANGSHFDDLSFRSKTQLKYSC